MNLSDIILIAIGLAMDCFAVSIACGIAMKPFRLWPAFRIALLFGLFQAMMPWIGWLAGNTFKHLIESFDHWIAFGILLILGGRMLWDYFFVHPDKKILNPYKKRVVLTLALATSIDALAVGLSFAFLHIDLILSVTIIGAASLFFSSLGLFIGHRYGHRYNIPAELFGGIVLIGIGIKILIEHLSR
jgi:manganese efflux pump family protein